MMTKKMILGAAMIAFAAQAQTAEARVSYVCPELNASSKQLQIPTIGR